MPDITNLKFGCLPAQFPGELRDLTYYAAGPLPKPPPSVTVPTVANWGMLGNDTAGDCGVAGLEHVFMTDASITHENEAEASDQSALNYYFKYTNGQDTGVVLSQYLQYVRTHGYYSHKVEAYAPVAVHDIPTLQTAVSLYGAAYTGIYVTDVMQQEFGAGEPWDMAGANGKVMGGHCVPICGYDDQFVYIVTWGAVQRITYPAWHAISTEAWAIITGEFVARNGDGRGVSLSALNADLNRLSK